MASMGLLIYGGVMWLACGFTYLLSLNDVRTLREVGVWIKPMKFMAATALFAWTTVWAAHLANAAVTHGQAYLGMSILLAVTSFLKWPTSPTKPHMDRHPTTTPATLGTP